MDGCLNALDSFEHPVRRRPANEKLVFSYDDRCSTAPSTAYSVISYTTRLSLNLRMRKDRFRGQQ
jgi:hypothetical protein